MLTEAHQVAARAPGASRSRWASAVHCTIEKNSSAWLSHDAWTGRWISSALSRAACIRATGVLRACEELELDRLVVERGVRRRRIDDLALAT